jgi:hypothetical protein
MTRLHSTLVGVNEQFWQDTCKAKRIMEIAWLDQQGVGDGAGRGFSQD